MGKTQANLIYEYGATRHLQAQTSMLQEREEICCFYLSTFGSKSDEFILQGQIVSFVSFSQDNSSPTKLSKFLYLKILVHKNEKFVKQNHSAKQNL